jgi:hypothetical protein
MASVVRHCYHCIFCRNIVATVHGCGHLTMNSVTALMTSPQHGSNRTRLWSTRRTWLNDSLALAARKLNIVLVMYGARLHLEFCCVRVSVIGLPAVRCASSTAIYTRGCHA